MYFQNWKILAMAMMQMQGDNKTEGAEHEEGT